MYLTSIKNQFENCQENSDQCQNVSILCETINQANKVFKPTVTERSLRQDKHAQKLWIELTKAMTETNSLGILNMSYRL